MKLIDGNLVKTIMQFTKDAMGIDLEEKQVSNAIRALRFSENITLANAIANDDAEKVKELLNLSDQEETMEAGYGSQGTQAAASSTIKAQTTKANNQNRRANNAAQDQARDSMAAGRTVAGGNKTATGSAQRSAPDLDGQQRQQNAQTADYATQLAQQNAQRIEQLVKRQR
jgi:hypothetical protein